MNFIVFIVLACGHLASESASELVKTRTVFIGRKNYKGELDMKNDDNDLIFTAQKGPTNRDGLEDWVSKKGVLKGSPIAPVYYAYFGGGQVHSRMYRENGTFILEHLKPECLSSSKTIGTKSGRFFNDYSFSRDGKLIVSFSRRWLSLVTKYAITMEAGSDTCDNFATFVLFFQFQHGDDTPT
ncbi:hypothetical protein Ddc_18619 [Ditylenchus destructor]|nr:hypothetical protein Ddc_18619 [Ditylenchus destructor]